MLFNTEHNIDYLIIRSVGFTELEKLKIIDSYNRIGKDNFYEYTKNKKILPFAAKTLTSLEQDTFFWLPIIEEYRERNRKVIAFLDSAYEAMAQYGVKNVFLTENFGALLSHSSDIGLFASNDVDNCYAEEEKDKIYKALESIGCTKKEIYALNRLNSTSWYPPFKYGLPEGFYLSMQPKPLSRLYLPSFVDVFDFNGWENLSFYQDTHIRLPNPTVLMYICMLHISLHSYSRAPDIRLYIDIFNLSKLKIDYEEIIKWCNNNHTKIRVSVVSTISNKLLKTNIPEKVTNLSTKKERILSLVYNQKKNELIYEPRGMKIFFIEALCNDKGFIYGLGNIIFPNKEWVRHTYGDCSLLSYIKHIKRIVK